MQRENSFIHITLVCSEGVTQTRQVNHVLCVTSMKDLMEKRLANIVDRPWARQLWAMKPAFSSARQIASSPSFQFQLGMFSRWAFITRYRQKVTRQKKNCTNDSYFLKEQFDILEKYVYLLSDGKLAKIGTNHMFVW